MVAVKKILLLLVSAFVVVYAGAQNYNHPTTGIQSSYVGACMVNNCSGNYYDDGGPSSNYSNNVNNIYRTFCSNAPGQCIRLTFSSFDVESFVGFCVDELFILDGPTQNSPLIWRGCGTSLPPVITANNPSGCITVRFFSDNNTRRPGWASAISCVPCSTDPAGADGGPDEGLNNDCAYAEYVCNNVNSFTANSQGPGLNADVCISGCALSENYSNWYILNVTSGGTLGMTITPTPNNADYDFALYGPVTGGCGNLGSPIRCSYAANTGPTGMNFTALDASEDVNGDGWVSAPTVTPGIYYLMINEWEHVPGASFTLSWSGTAVIGLPEPVIAYDPACTNSPLRLYAPGVYGATFNWTGPGGWTSTDPNPVRNPAVAGTYTMNYTVNGCTSATASVSISLGDPPTINTNVLAATLCPGQNIFINASGGVSYLWSNGTTDATVNANPTITTDYIVTVTSGNGCTSSRTIPITVLDPPSASISPATAEICQGDSVTLTASGGTSYFWSNGQGGPSITVSPTNNTTYSVTVIASNSCSAVPTRTVTVKPSPTASINPATHALCFGQSVTLTASGGGTYNWSNGTSANSITVSPASTTLYSVTVTGTNGCTASATSTVTVNPLPVAAVSPPLTEICFGESVALTASGGGSYSWSNGGSGNTITVSPSINTQYSVTVISSFGCTASAASTVIVNPLPLPYIDPFTASVCGGESITLTAYGGVFYDWSTFDVDQSIVVTPFMSETYTVTVTDANGCSATTSKYVAYADAPFVFISPSETFLCPGESVILTANGAQDYVWSSGENGPSIVDYPVESTTYSVTGTDANGCTAEASETIEVSELTNATISPNNPIICSAQNVTLTASGGVFYQWNTGAFGESLTAFIFATTTYTVTVYDAQNCTVSLSETVTVENPPTATISPATATVCNGQSVTLTASGGVSYVWNTGATTADITVTPASPTTYTVIVTSAAGCTATASRTVNISGSISASVTPAAPTICPGNSVTLTASGGNTYVWSTGANTAAINVSPPATTTYTVTVTNTAGCTVAVSATVTVNNIPVANISPANPAICVGESVTLTASGGTNYVWSNSVNTAANTVSPVTTTTYTVTVSDAAGCSAIASETVTVNTSPMAAITPSAPAICLGASVTLTASGGTSYMWSGGENSASITVNPAVNTTYSVTVSGGANCTANASLTVIVNTPPTASIAPATAALCSGENITLAASGGASYVWNTGDNTAQITVSPTTNTTYNVIVTDVNGCTATASRTVTVNNAPTTSISPATAEICSGGSITLTASGGVSYVWNTGGNTAQITVSPTSNTTYNVIVTDANGCTATTSRTVVVNALPTASIAPTNPGICLGESVTLTASGGVSYSWNTGDNTAQITVSPASNTTYIVIVIDANGCTAIASETVTVNTQPVAAITPASPAICAGESVTLTASGGTTYLWSGGENTAAISVSPVSNTTYSVTVFNGSNCSADASVSVTVNNAPTANISPATAEICSGGSITLTASGGVSYAWNTGDNTAQITVSPTSNTTYSVIVTDANGCTATTSRTVTVNALPTASIAPANPGICVGESVTLTASGGVSYSWNTGDNTAQITVSPASNTTYIVIVIDANGCTAIASETVTVNTQPVAAITPASPAICAGESVTLTASGGTTYLWSGGENTAAISVSPVSNTTYSVTVFNGSNCSADASVSVTVNNAPTANISPATAEICSGGSITLTASGGVSYAWNTGDNTAQITVSPTSNTTYNVILTDANGCTATTSRTVTVNTLPTASIAPANPVICVGESVTLTASGGVSYSWNTGDNTAQITVSPVSNTTYDVIVTNANGCTATASETVTVNTQPVAAITPASPAICAGESVTLTASGGTTYLWSGGENTAAISVSPVNTTTYTVTVTNATGCSATVSETITVNARPVADITPDNPSVCIGENLTLTAFGGVSYAWNTGDNTEQITVSPTNNTAYDVVVTDANGCTANATETVTVISNLVASITPANPAICAGTSITLSASGGNSYVWSSGQNTASIIVSPLVDTDYTVTVSGGGNCTADATVTVVVNATPVAAVSPATQSVCEGTSATLIASGGVNYTWNTGDNTAQITVSPTTNTIYDVVVTDANGCTAAASGSVNIIAAPIAAISPSNSAICSGENITLTATGGVSYSWNTGDNTEQITVSPNINTAYDVVVTDANGCTATASKTVIVNSLPVASITPSAPGICAGESVTLIASGGNNYSWNTGDNTAQITVSPINNTNYDVLVTDGNNCTATAAVTVMVNSVPAVTISLVNPAICVGESVTLIASGGNSYVWSTGDITAQITVSPNANTIYDVVATDANGCTAFASELLTVNALPTAVVSPANTTSCPGQTIILTASGGTIYNWNTGDNTESISVSPALITTYEVTVTDNNNCSATASATIDPTAGLTVNTASENISCFGLSDGSITVNVSGGVPPFDFIWNDANQNQNRTNLYAANYSLTISDAGGCEAIENFIITEPDEIIITATVTDIVCAGNNIGSITLNISGGTGTYDFVWNDGNLNQNRTNLPAGNYDVVVTDNNGCSETDSYTITMPAALTVTVAHTDITCFGNNDGSISLTVSGGIAPYDFIWGDGNQNQNRTNLSGATYSVTVSDANNCESLVLQTITEPAAIFINAVTSNITCNGANNGSITVSVSGGNGFFSFEWNDGNQNQNRNNLSEGNYIITATDTSGCTATASANIAEPSALIVSLLAVDIACGNESTGSITAAVSGGTPPYSFIWNDNDVNQNRNNLASGNYSVTVEDVSNCSANASTTITAPDAIVVAASIVNESCAGFSDGNISLQITGGNPAYNIVWSDNMNGTTRNNLLPGNYSATITDANGCSVSESYNISVGAVLNISANVSNASCPPAEDGAINITVTGNTGTIIYEWSNGSALNNQEFLIPGSYTVTITDANGCSAESSYSITYTFTQTVSITAPDTVTKGTTITLSATASPSANVSYYWEPSTGLSCNDCSAPSLTVNESGWYSVTAFNTAGCEAADSVYVTVLPVPTVYAPSAFSPNGDGLNDEFALDGIIGEAVQFNIMIFDRWGEKVFESDQYDFRWDGKFKGRDLPPGVYVFHVKYRIRNYDKILEKRSSITLIR